MFDFKFLAPDGYYRTFNQDQFSDVYLSGAVPVELFPEVSVLSPSGMIEKLDHREAAARIRTQGFSLINEPKAIKVAGPDRKIYSINPEQASFAFSNGGTPIYKELLSREINPQIAKATVSDPESPFSNWFGPTPKEPEKLKRWDKYTQLLEKNRKGPAGLLEGINPFDLSVIPWVGSAADVIDAGRVLVTAEKMRDGKQVSDQDVLDLNIYLAELERQSDATFWGKTGRVIRDSMTFGAEIGSSILATVFTGGLASPAIATALARKAAGEGLEIAVKGAAKSATRSFSTQALESAATKFLADQSTKNFANLVTTKGFINRVVRPATKEWAQMALGKEAAEQMAGTGARLTMRQKAAGAAADMAVFALPPTIAQVGIQSATALAAGQPVSTVRGNQDNLFRALQGEDTDVASGFWYGVGDQLIENFSESMGAYLGFGVAKLAGGGAALSRAGGQKMGSFLDDLLAKSVGPENAAQLATKTKALAGFSRFVGEKMRPVKDKVTEFARSYSDVMELFRQVGYDGVLEEMLEERAGDFMRGLFGLEGEEADNAIKRAFKNTWPGLEQLGIEAVAFSAPMAFSIATPALLGNRRYKDAMAEIKQISQQAYLGSGKVEPGQEVPTADKERSEAGLKLLYKEVKRREMASQVDQPALKLINKVTDHLFGVQYLPASETESGGFVWDIEDKMAYTQTGPLPTFMREAEKAELARSPNATPAQLEKAAINAGQRALAVYNNFIMLNRESPNGYVSDKKLGEYFTQSEVQYLSNAGLLVRDNKENRWFLQDLGELSPEAQDKIFNYSAKHQDAVDALLSGEAAGAKLSERQQRYLNAAQRRLEVLSRITGREGKELTPDDIVELRGMGIFTRRNTAVDEGKSITFKMANSVYGDLDPMLPDESRTRVQNIRLKWLVEGASGLTPEEADILRLDLVAGLAPENMDLDLIRARDFSQVTGDLVARRDGKLAVKGDYLVSRQTGAVFEVDAVESGSLKLRPSGSSESTEPISVSQASVGIDYILDRDLSADNPIKNFQKRLGVQRIVSAERYFAGTLENVIDSVGGLGYAGQKPEKPKENATPEELRIYRDQSRAYYSPSKINTFAYKTGRFYDKAGKNIVSSDTPGARPEWAYKLGATTNRIDGVVSTYLPGQLGMGGLYNKEDSIEARLGPIVDLDALGLLEPLNAALLRLESGEVTLTPEEKEAVKNAPKPGLSFSNENMEFASKVALYILGDNLSAPQAYATPWFDFLTVLRDKGGLTKEALLPFQAELERRLGPEFVRGLQYQPAPAAAQTVASQKAQARTRAEEAAAQRQIDEAEAAKQPKEGEAPEPAIPPAPAPSATEASPERRAAIEETKVAVVSRAERERAELKFTTKAVKELAEREGLTREDLEAVGGEKSSKGFYTKRQVDEAIRRRQQPDLPTAPTPTPTSTPTPAPTFSPADVARVNELVQKQGYVEFGSTTAAELFRKQYPNWTEIVVEGKSRFSPPPAASAAPAEPAAPTSAPTPKQTTAKASPDTSESIDRARNRFSAAVQKKEPEQASPPTRPAAAPPEEPLKVEQRQVIVTMYQVLDALAINDVIADAALEDALIKEVSRMQTLDLDAAKKVLTDYVQSEQFTADMLQVRGVDSGRGEEDVDSLNEELFANQLLSSEDRASKFFIKNMNVIRHVLEAVFGERDMTVSLIQSMRAAGTPVWKELAGTNFGVELPAFMQTEASFDAWRRGVELNVESLKNREFNQQSVGELFKFILSRLPYRYVEQVYKSLAFAPVRATQLNVSEAGVFARTLNTNRQGAIFNGFRRLMQDLTPGSEASNKLFDLLKEMEGHFFQSVADQKVSGAQANINRVLQKAAEKLTSGKATPAEKALLKTAGEILSRVTFGEVNLRYGKAIIDGLVRPEVDASGARRTTDRKKTLTSAATFVRVDKVFRELDKFVDTPVAERDAKLPELRASIFSMLGENDLSVGLGGVPIGEEVSIPNEFPLLQLFVDFANEGGLSSTGRGSNGQYSGVLGASPLTRAAMKLKKNLRRFDEVLVPSQRAGAVEGEKRVVEGSDLTVAQRFVLLKQLVANSFDRDGYGGTGYSNPLFLADKSQFMALDLPFSDYYTEAQFEEFEDSDAFVADFFSENGPAEKAFAELYTEIWGPLAQFEAGRKAREAFLKRMAQTSTTAIPEFLDRPGVLPNGYIVDTPEGKAIRLLVVEKNPALNDAGLGDGAWVYGSEALDSMINYGVFPKNTKITKHIFSGKYNNSGLLIKGAGFHPDNFTEDVFASPGSEEEVPLGEFVKRANRAAVSEKAFAVVPPSTAKLISIPESARRISITANATNPETGVSQPINFSMREVLVPVELFGRVMDFPSEARSYSNNFPLQALSGVIGSAYAVLGDKAAPFVSYILERNRSYMEWTMGSSAYRAEKKDRKLYAASEFEKAGIENTKDITQLVQRIQVAERKIADGMAETEQQRAEREQLDEILAKVAPENMAAVQTAIAVLRQETPVPEDHRQAAEQMFRRDLAKALAQRSPHLSRFVKNGISLTNPLIAPEVTRFIINKFVTEMGAGEKLKKVLLLDSPVSSSGTGESTNAPYTINGQTRLVEHEAGQVPGVIPSRKLRVGGKEFYGEAEVEMDIPAEMEWDTNVLFSLLRKSNLWTPKATAKAVKAEVKTGKGRSKNKKLFNEKQFEQILTELFRPIREISPFIPLDGSTPFGSSWEEASKYISYLQSEYNILLDFATFDPNAQGIPFTLEREGNYTGQYVRPNYRTVATVARSGIILPGTVFSSSRIPAVGGPQSSFPVRLTRRVPGAKIKLSRRNAEQRGSDYDGDGTHVYVLPAGVMGAWIAIYDQFNESETQLAAKSDPGAFLKSNSTALFLERARELKSGWLNQNLRVSSEEFLTQGGQAAKDASSGIGIKAVSGSSVSYLFNVPLERNEVTSLTNGEDQFGLPPLVISKTPGRVDAWTQWRMKVSYDLTQVVVDGAKSPEENSLLAITPETVALFEAAIMSAELPAEVPATGAYDEVMRRAVLPLSSFLLTRPEGQMFLQNMRDNFSVPNPIRSLFEGVPTNELSGAYAIIAANAPDLVAMGEEETTLSAEEKIRRTGEINKLLTIDGMSDSLRYLIGLANETRFFGDLFRFAQTTSREGLSSLRRKQFNLQKYMEGEADVSLGSFSDRTLRYLAPFRTLPENHPGRIMLESAQVAINAAESAIREQDLELINNNAWLWQLRNFDNTFLMRGMGQVEDWKDRNWKKILEFQTKKVKEKGKTKNVPDSSTLVVRTRERDAVTSALRDSYLVQALATMREESGRSGKVSTVDLLRNTVAEVKRMQGMPEYSGNAALNNLIASVFIPAKSNRERKTFRLSQQFFQLEKQDGSEAEMTSAWNRLPVNLQIDLLDLFVRASGSLRVRESFAQIMSLDFMRNLDSKVAATRAFWENPELWTAGKYVETEEGKTMVNELEDLFMYRYNEASMPVVFSGVSALPGSYQDSSRTAFVIPQEINEFDSSDRLGEKIVKVNRELNDVWTVTSGEESFVITESQAKVYWKRAKKGVEKSEFSTPAAVSQAPAPAPATREPTPTGYGEQVTSLEPNDVFVFGSNLQGFHGGGSAGFATFGRRVGYREWEKLGYGKVSRGWRGKWNIRGQGEGLQTGTEGTSYALPTVTKPGAKRSLTPEQITNNIRKMYDVARQNPDKRFLVAGSTSGPLLNGYSHKEMAKFYGAAGPIPANVVFSNSYAALIRISAPATQEPVTNVVAVAEKAKAPAAYGNKERAKAEVANKVLAPLAKNVSDKSYAKRLAQEAKKAGVLVQNVSQVEAGDRVYVSVPGKGRGQTQEQLQAQIGNAVAVLAKGATIITDNKANAERDWNVEGEGELRKFLLAVNAKETDKGLYSEWVRSAQVVPPISAAIEGNPELKDEFKGKIIFAQSGMGKTRLASILPNVIDTDEILARLAGTTVDGINVIWQGRTDEESNIIFRKMGEEVLQGLKQGKTVLSPSIKLLNIMPELADQSVIVMQAAPDVMKARREAEDRVNVLKTSMEGAVSSYQLFFQQAINSGVPVYRATRQEFLSDIVLKNPRTYAPSPEERINSDVAQALKEMLEKFGFTFDLADVKQKYNLDSLGFISTVSKLIAFDENADDVTPFIEEGVKLILDMSKSNPAIKSAFKEVRSTPEYLDAVKALGGTFTPELLEAAAEYVRKGDASDKQQYKQAQKLEVIDTDIAMPILAKQVAEYLKAQQGKVSTIRNNPTIMQRMKKLWDSLRELLGKMASDWRSLTLSVADIGNSILVGDKYLFSPSRMAKDFVRVPRIQELMDLNPVQRDVLEKLMPKAFVLTGSAVIAEQGSVLRRIDSLLHDLDTVGPAEMSEQEVHDFVVSTFPGAFLFTKIQDKNKEASTLSYILPEEGTKVSKLDLSGYRTVTDPLTLENVQEFGGGKLIKYEISDAETGALLVSYDNVALVSNTPTPLKEGERVKKGTILDVFVKSKEIAPPLSRKIETPTGSFNLILADAVVPWYAKLEFARFKDRRDYNNYWPMPETTERAVSLIMQQGPSSILIKPFGASKTTAAIASTPAQALAWAGNRSARSVLEVPEDRPITGKGVNQYTERRAREIMRGFNRRWKFLAEDIQGILEEDGVPVQVRADRVRNYVADQRQKERWPKGSGGAAFDRNIENLLQANYAGTEAMEDLSEVAGETMLEEATRLVAEDTARAGQPLDSAAIESLPVNAQKPAAEVPSQIFGTTIQPPPAPVTSPVRLARKAFAGNPVEFSDDLVKQGVRIVQGEPGYDLASNTVTFNEPGQAASVVADMAVAGLAVDATVLTDDIKGTEAYISNLDSRLIRSFAGKPLEALVAEEVKRKLHNQASLFRLEANNPVAVLADQIASEIKLGRTKELINEGRVGLSKTGPKLTFGEPRRVDPYEYPVALVQEYEREGNLSERQSSELQKAIQRDPIEGLAMIRDLDAQGVFDENQSLRKSLEDALPPSAYIMQQGFSYSDAKDVSAAIAGLIPMADSRLALLKNSGIAGMHHLLVELRNTANAAQLDEQSWQNWYTGLLGDGSVKVLIWDPKKDNGIDENGKERPKGGWKGKLTRHAFAATARDLQDRDLALLMVAGAQEVRNLKWGSEAWRNHTVPLRKNIYEYDQNGLIKRDAEGKPVVIQGVTSGDSQLITLGELLDRWNNSGFKRRLLAEGGRSEEMINLETLSQDIGKRFDEDQRMLNEAAWIFNGRDFIQYRRNYLSNRYGSGSTPDPISTHAMELLYRGIRKADAGNSALGVKNPEVSPADLRVIEWRAKIKGDKTIPEASKAQKDLIRRLYSEAELEKLPRQESVGETRGDLFIDTVTANRLIQKRMHATLLNEIREYYERNPDSLGKRDWKPNPLAQKYLDTLKQLESVNDRTKFLTDANPLHPKIYNTWAEAFLDSRKDNPNNPSAWLLPDTNDILRIRSRYVFEVHNALINRAALSGFMTIKDVTGMPMIMVNPANREAVMEGYVSQDVWREAATNWSNAAELQDPFDPSKDLYDEVSRVYSLALKKVSQLADLRTVTSPKTPGIVEFKATTKQSAQVLNQLVQVPFTETNDVLKAALQVVQWTKLLSVGFSSFFFVALGESTISASGVRRNLLLQAMFDRPEFKKAMRGIKSYRLAQQYYNPQIASRARRMYQYGTKSRQASQIYDPNIAPVYEKIDGWTDNLRQLYGDKVADRFSSFMVGGKAAGPGAGGIANMWPGLSGKKFSDFMFNWFSAVKEWQTEYIMVNAALDAGLSAKNALMVPRHIARPIVQYVNETLGGNDWHQLIWATPNMLAGLSLGMFAPQWTYAAWMSSGGGLLTQKIFKTYYAPGEAPFIFGSLIAMWALVMHAIPNAMQAAFWAVGQALGAGDPDDVPLTYLNEPGREEHIDITPLQRLLPWYAGEPTGQRRLYIQFAKQIHETGVLNPGGARGWINEPYNQLMRKLSQPAKYVLEFMTGKSPGSDWDLEFKDKGLLGLVHSGEPGFAGFWTSRIGYGLQKMVPLSFSTLADNPEVLPANFFAPISKGTSQSKVIENMERVLETYASREDWHRIRKVPRARANLESLMPELMRAARMNGYDAKKALDSARGRVLGRYYDKMWQAVNRDDVSAMNEAAASIYRVWGTAQGLKSSFSNKSRTYTKPITDEQKQQALDALEQAYNGQF